jgi:hypothetical protein
MLKILRRKRMTILTIVGLSTTSTPLKNENSQFYILLQEVLQHLGYTMKTLYVTKYFSESGMRDYYTSRVCIRVPLIDTNGWRNRSSHHSTAHFSIDEAAVNDAARRALWSLCNA